MPKDPVFGIPLVFFNFFFEDKGPNEEPSFSLQKNFKLKLGCFGLR
jgi:hypothetical protein